MTTLGIDPGNYQLRWPKGSPYLLRLKFSKGEGGFLDLTGRVLRFAAYRAGGKVVYDAPIVIDGDTGTVLFDGSVSLLAGLDGASWQVAQVFDDGATPLFRGSIYVSAAAAGQGTGAGAPPSDLLIWDPSPQTLIVSGVGTPGISPWDAAGQTFEEYDAAIRAPLLEAVVDVTQQVGATITELGEAASEKFAEVDDHIALKVEQVDDAITELGEFTSERSAEIDDKLTGVNTFVTAKNVVIDAKLTSFDVFVAGKTVVLDAAREAANSAATLANNKAALAQTVVDGGASILAAVPVVQGARAATEAARDQVATTATGLRFDLTSTLYTPWGKKVVFARVDPTYGVGDVITEDGVHSANYSIRVNGATWTRGIDGFWTLDLSALALAKYSFASGDVIDGTKTRYYKGKKVNWAVVDKNLAVALCVTEDGKVYAEDFESPATDITKAVFPQVTFNTGETIVTSTVTRYYNGQPVTWARTDKDGRASIVELASGKVVIPDFESPALDLAGGNAPLETQGYVFAEVLVAGTKQVQRYSKATGKGSVATSTGNNFAPRLSFDGSKVVFLSDRSGVKEGWYQQLDGAKFGGAVTHPVVARKTITAVGDSLTAGDYAGLVAQTFGTSQTTPSSAPTDGSLVSAGGGIGSQQSPQIAARFGAVGNLTCSLAGGTMVDGANTLTAISINLIGRAGDQAGAVRYLRASILGVSGWLKSAQQSTSANGALPSGDGFYLYTFTPDAGQTLPVAVPANTSLVIDPENRQDSILLIWAGSNDVGNPGWQATVKAMIASMIAVHKPLVPNYLVLSILNSNQRPAGNAQHDEIVAFNLELAAIYGDNYVDVRTPYNAGTTDDTPNPAYSIDGLHYNVAGRAIIAGPVIARIQAKGWLP